MKNIGNGCEQSDKKEANVFSQVWLYFYSHDRTNCHANIWPLVQMSLTPM